MRRPGYEAKEVDGRWRVARLDPVVAVLTGRAPRRQPVHLTIVRPKLDEPALGAALAGRTDDAGVELSVSLEPGDASVRVVRALGARVRSVESRDGRFRIRVALQRGTNRLLLEASAAGREAIELSVRLTRAGRAMRRLIENFGDEPGVWRCVCCTVNRYVAAPRARRATLMPGGGSP